MWGIAQISHSSLAILETQVKTLGIDSHHFQTTFGKNSFNSKEKLPCQKETLISEKWNFNSTS